VEEILPRVGRSEPMVWHLEADVYVPEKNNAVSLLSKAIFSINLSKLLILLNGKPID
jgi:hypothetical protein